MDVGFLFFYFYDKLYNCVYFVINSEGNIFFFVKEIGLYIEGVIGVCEIERIMLVILGLLGF